jgi:hypothetical protein
MAAYEDFDFFQRSSPRSTATVVAPRASDPARERRHRAWHRRVRRLLARLTRRSALAKSRR